MRYGRLGLLISLVLFATGCSITRVKWRIKWDRRIEKGHTAYLEETKPTPSITRKPNVIILLADDLGKYEVSAYGAQHIQTPHIDQIAAEGVLPEEGYTTSPTCAPSRAGLMTGRVQNRFGFETQLMDYYPTNWVEYMAGKWFVDTGAFVRDTERDGPARRPTPAPTSTPDGQSRHDFLRQTQAEQTPAWPNNGARREGKRCPCCFDHAHEGQQHFLPADLLAEQHRKMAAPGSAHKA